MTLQELLDLKVVKDNILIAVFERDIYGLGNIIAEYHVNRKMGGLVTKEDLAKIKEEYFSYKVKEIWGTVWKNKMAIVIEKEER